MKKIITTLLLALVLVLSLGITAFAQEIDASNPILKEKAVIFQQKRQELREFKTTVKEKVSIIRDNTKNNKELWQNNAALRADIKATLQQIKNSGNKIDEAVKEQYKALRTALSEKLTELKATQGQIKDLTKGLKALIKAKDTAAIDSIYAEILDIQLNRDTKLAEINTILTEINALV